MVSTLTMCASTSNAKSVDVTPHEEFLLSRLYRDRAQPQSLIDFIEAVLDMRPIVPHICSAVLIGKAIDRRKRGQALRI
jgi:hypothetical protein